MKKFFGALFIILLAAVVFLIVAKDWVLKAAVEQSVTRLTGFKTTLQDLKYDFPSTITMKGLEIDNPEGFHQKTFVSLPEIYASLELKELLTEKKIHLPEVRLNIQTVNIERNDKGVSNVELLSSVANKSQEAAAPAPPAEKKEPIPFWLEKLELTVRNVTFEDRSSMMGIGVTQTVPRKLAVDLNLQKEVFTDIRDPQVLVNLIVVKILNSATLGRLLNIDPQKLVQENVGRVLATGQELVAKPTAVLGQATSAVTQAEVTQRAEKLLKGASGTAKDTLTGTTSAVKDQVTGLFGKLKPSSTPEEVPAEKTA